MAKKSAYGEGSVYYLKKRGYWQASFIIGGDQRGGLKRKYFTGKTRKEVVQKLERWKTSFTTEGSVVPEKVRLVTFLDDWLNTIHSTVRKTTISGYQSIVRAHLKPRLGDQYPDKISTAQIQSFYAKLINEGKSPYLIRQVHAVLHRAFNYAVRNGLIQTNPCHGVEKPKLPRKSIDTDFRELFSRQN